MTSIENVEAACAALAAAAKQLASVLHDSLSADKMWPGMETRSDDDVVQAEPPQPAQVAPKHRDAANTITPRQRIFIYMAGLRGLAELTRARGCAIMTALGLVQEPYVPKIGTTTVPLEARLRQIGQDQYGAAVRTAAGVTTEPGFSRWVAHAVAPSRPPCDPAVTLLPRAIRVDLPTGMTRRSFDGALHRALQARALDGLPTSVLPKRFCAYDLIATRLSAATEFYALSPHLPADCDLLLDAVEVILRRHGAAKG